MRLRRLAFVLLVTTLLVQPAEAEPATDRFHISDDQVGDLIETLLEGNPRLSSVSARSESFRARIPQARSLPDPRVNYRYFAKTPETRVGSQEHMFEFSQGIPWGGKRKLQAERAGLVASGHDWEVEGLERELVAGLKRKYFEAAYLQEALTVNLEEHALLERFEAIALRRYATGKGIQQSVVRVQTEISRLDDRKAELRRRLGVVVRGILELIGQPERTWTLNPIDLALPDLEYDRENMEQFATAQHPRVHAVEERVEADRVWARRRALESRPDFRVGLGYTLVGQRDDLAGMLNPPEGNGQDIVALAFGLNIPIHRKKIHAGVAEARESERANGELLVAVQDRLRFEIQEALLRLDSLDERSRLYLEVIIPQAQESLASAEAAYTADRLGFLDILDAERILFQSRLAYHRLVADLWIALADLELAAGHPFPTQDYRHD